MNFDMFLNPKKYNLKQCNHCNGYGSSLKDPIGVNKCTVCFGTGLIKYLSQKEESENDK